MATEQISPALTPDEWAKVPWDLYAARAYADQCEFDKAMAAANYHRSDDDPGKITAADVERIEVLAEEDEHVHELRGWKDHVSPWRKLSSKLAALLPPHRDTPTT